jgi:hypothetical protein
VFVNSDGSAHARYRQALHAGDLLLVRATAPEPGYVGLADALAILELIEAHEEDRFDAARVRLVGRLALEALFVNSGSAMNPPGSTEVG